AGDVADRLCAGERIDAVDVHGAGAADALPAGAAEGQRRVDIVLDIDQRVQHHRPAFGEVDFVSVDARVAVLVGVPAVNAELARLLRPGGRGVRLALDAAGVFRQSQLYHLL